jgi:hypothetical protein
MSDMTKQEKINAAVAVVQEQAAAALRGEQSQRMRAGYVDADTVSTVLVKQGVLDTVETRSGSARDAEQRRLRGQAKRLLDEEAKLPGGRILRFSSADRKTLPYLDSERRFQYGQTVDYTTPELYERALTAVQARLDRERAEELEIASLLDQATAAGFPKPKTATRLSVTYDIAGLRALLELVSSST